MIKNKNPGGFVDRQHKGLGMGEEENRRFFLALRARSRALADVSEKNEKKTRTTSCTGYNVSYTPLHSKVNPFKS